MHFFSQRGLKNLKMSFDFRVLSSPFACSLQKSPIVTSFAAVTILPTVISLFSATFRCSSRNSHICFISCGALSLVLSVTFSSLGVRNGHLPLSFVRRMPSIPLVFRLQSHYFSRCLAPPPNSGNRNRQLHTPKPGWLSVELSQDVIPYLRVELQLPGKNRHLQTKDLVQHNQNIRELVKAH